MNKFKTVTSIIFNDFGQVLMQLRDGNTERCPNMWCFPGGYIEPEENPIETAIRETEEEHGLKFEANDFEELMTHELPFGGISEIFICKLKEGQIPVLNEGAEMRWMSIDEIKKLELGFEHKKIISKLEEFLLRRNK